MTEEAVSAGLRERKRAQSRAAAVDTAMRLFAERGYDAVTVADICAAAEIAPRTFFRYFPTKEEVLAEPARQMAGRLTEAIAAAPDGLTDEDVLVGALRALGDYVVDRRDQLSVFFRAAASASAVRTHPFLHLSSRERQISEQLADRRGTAADWRTRLLVARALAGYRVWLDDLVAGVSADPLAHLDEVLAAG